MQHPLIISRLIESGRDVYLPIGTDELVTFTDDIGFEKIICINAYQDKDSTPFIKTPTGIESYAYISCVDKETKTVWLLPVELFESRTMLRLGKKYEDFIIPPPISLTTEEQKRRRQDKNQNLASQAAEIARRLMEGN